MREEPGNLYDSIESVDPELAQRLRALSECVVAAESEIPRKYKELILLACAAALRFDAGVRQRGIEAMHHGASEKEVMEALALASATSEMSLWSTAIETLGDQFTLQGQPHS